MMCPNCKQETKSSVIASAKTHGGIRRRRVCSGCSRRYNTLETPHDFKAVPDPVETLKSRAIAREINGLLADLRYLTWTRASPYPSTVEGGSSLSSMEALSFRPMRRGLLQTYGRASLHTLPPRR